MRPGAVKAYLGIHVGAIHINLTTVLVDDIGDLFYCLFIYTIRAGVSDHDTGKLFAVLSSLCLQVLHIDITVLEGFYYYHLMPAITALARLVPCALMGIRITLRCASPRLSW